MEQKPPADRWGGEKGERGEGEPAASRRGGGGTPPPVGERRQCRRRPKKEMVEVRSGNKEGCQELCVALGWSSVRAAVWRAALGRMH